MTGDACTASADCIAIGSTCSSGTCTVSSGNTGAICAYSFDCNVGFYCAGNKCAQVVAEG